MYQGTRAWGIKTRGKNPRRHRPAQLCADQSAHPQPNQLRLTYVGRAGIGCCTHRPFLASHRSTRLRTTQARIRTCTTSAIHGSHSISHRHPSLSAHCGHEPPALDFVSVRFARANIVHSSHVMENGKFPLHPGHTPCPVDHDTHVQLPQKGITDER